MPGPLHVAAVAALLLAGTTGAVVIPATQTSTAEAPPPARQADPARGDRQPVQRGSKGANEVVPAEAEKTERARPRSDARPAQAREMVRATMRIPEIDLRGLTVVPYHGSPDDGPGTRIQNGGVAATPIGPRGGVGPGQVGNYIVTAHRTTSPAPFADLPALRRGDHVFVRAAGRVFDYRVTKTRWTSFRSKRSLREQSAAVPGRPGAEAEQAMVTLSTCATPEDHARGNYWSDEFGNPEHRIDKVGVLVDVRRARPSRDQRTGGR